MKWYIQLGKDILVLLWSLFVGLLPIIILGVALVFANAHTPIVTL